MNLGEISNYGCLVGKILAMFLTIKNILTTNLYQNIHLKWKDLIFKNFIIMIIYIIKMNMFFNYFQIIIKGK